MRRIWLLFYACALAFPSDALAQDNAALNPGFEDGAVGEAPTAWEFSSTDGALVSQAAAYTGRQGVAISADGLLRQRIEAVPFRSRRIRLSGMARAEGPEKAWADFWVRVDGPGGRVPFIGYSGRSGQAWERYDIYVPVPADAEAIVFGYVVQGGGQAQVDDVSIADFAAIDLGNEPPRALSRRGLDNLTALARLYGYVRYFHPSDEAAGADWDALALAGVERVEGARNRAELRQALQDVFAPVAAGLVIAARGAPVPAATSSETDTAWIHTGLGTRNLRSLYRSERAPAPPQLPAFARLDLPRGLAAFVPLRVRRGRDGAILPAAAASPLVPSKPEGFTPSGMDRTSRLAAVIQAWNLPQHFYPYFDVVGVDWARELATALRFAATDAGEAAFDLTMKRMMAALDDGHGAAGRNEPRARQPFRWEWIEGVLVVTRADEDAGVRLGDIARRIDGRNVEELIAAREALISAATPAFRRWVALTQIAAGDPGEVRMMTLERDGAVIDAQVALAPARVRFENAPSSYDTVADIEPGLVYVDLTRLTADEFEANIERLAAAERLVFDLRGYPANGWRDVIAHLAASQVRTARNNVPTYTQPDQHGVTFEDLSWPIEPQAPHFRGRAVFITDGRAVSQAETVMSIVEGFRLGEIVGAPTAGANGDAIGVQVLTNHGIGWTGLQVLRHDGSRFHGVGVTPTIPAHRTIAGVRAGRDEVLEAAIAATRNQPPLTSPFAPHAAQTPLCSTVKCPQAAHASTR